MFETTFDVYFLQRNDNLRTLLSMEKASMHVHLPPPVLL